VEKLGSAQIIKIQRRVFYLVRGPRAFVDETAHRFRIRGAQAGPARQPGRAAPATARRDASGVLNLYPHCDG
jgi:hypothetical protein